MSSIVEGGIASSIHCFLDDTPYNLGLRAGEQDAEKYLASAGCVPNYQQAASNTKWTAEKRLSAVLTCIRWEAIELERNLKSRFSDDGGQSGEDEE